MTFALPLLVAMILDAILGEPRWLWERLPHPAVLMGRAVATLDTRLNRGPNRRRNGVTAVALLVSGAGALGLALQALPLGLLPEVVVAAILLAQKSLVQHVRAIADGLRLSLEEGRKAVSMIVGRDTAEMNESAVVRAAVESAAENASDGVIAPAFWFLIAGLPGILIYKVVNTADSMIGHRTERYAEFGWAAARLDDLLNTVPARLTALLILIVTTRITDHRKVLADARRHRSPNAGWPEAAMARALDISLSGPRVYGGRPTRDPFVNACGRRDLSETDIDGAVAVLWRLWYLAVAAVAVLALV